ncbi:bacteriocin-like protein [Chryseobacterium gambrini]|uniref:bacteriocin-like protein n=1 Tax=Chryseobacterium gambrini TaxID=373672 RepID=UPI003D0CACB6
MKNLKKISRNAMKSIQGGIIKGMVRCKDPNTCVVQWGWGGGSSSNCGTFDIICGEAPPQDPCEYTLCI